MRAVVDFLAGRNNKLLRDMLAASAAVLLFCAVAVGSIRAAADAYRVARQPLPTRIDVARAQGGGPVMTVTRSVLDDPLLTGSVNGRPVVLDPCTGKDRK